MQNWQKYANYRKLKNEDGSFTYIITVDGEDVEVSEAVYKAYAAGDRKMRYIELDLKCDRVLQDENGKAVCQWQCICASTTDAILFVPKICTTSMIFVPKICISIKRDVSQAIGGTYQ